MSGPPKAAPRHVVSLQDAATCDHSFITTPRMTVCRYCGTWYRPAPIDLDAEIARLRERLGLLPIQNNNAHQ